MALKVGEYCWASFCLQLDLGCSSELCVSVVFMNFRTEESIITDQDIVFQF
jgi:hypothetical protein